MDEAREKQAFDVFLSHNSQDKPAVRTLAALLTERGIRISLHEQQLPPRDLLASALIEKHGYHRRRDDERTHALPAILPRSETDLP